MDVFPITTSPFPTAVVYPIIFFIMTLVAIHFYMESLRIVQMGKKLPGPPTVPFFGNALIPLGVHPKDALYTLLKYESYGNVIRAFLGTKLVIFIMDPRDVEIILSSTVHIDKSAEYRFFAPWLGQGLLISTGEKWRTHRKLIAPTFHLNVLKTFVPVFYENSRDLVLRLRQEVGKEFDCHDHLAAVTVDILLETAMGVRGRRDKTGFDYAMAVMKMCDIIHRRQYDIRIRPDSLFKMSKDFKLQKKLLGVIHGLTTSVIRSKKREYDKQNEEDSHRRVEDQKDLEGERKSENANKTTTSNQKMRYVRDDLDEIDENDVAAIVVKKYEMTLRSILGEKRRLAFLDMMLEMARNGANLTDEEIKEEVDTIMFEGHDTTAAGSSFVLCMLGIHQDVQARVYEELDDIFKGTHRECTFQDTLEMKYLERVIMETLRLFPPVPAIARHLNEDVRLASGDYILPKDSTVVIPPFKIHRLPEYYPNPEVFDPDNFLAEKTQNRHYYAFIPFSAGSRSCVGRKYAMLKLKVLLSTIIRNYKILSDLTEKDFRLKVDIILKRDDGFRIKIEPRDNKDVVTEVLSP